MSKTDKIIKTELYDNNLFVFMWRVSTVVLKWNTSHNISQYKIIFEITNKNMNKNRKEETKK